MRRFFKIGLFFLLLNKGSWVNAQNLVPNSSFDDVDTCNTEPNWLWNLTSWTNLGFYDGMADGTPDVYNACNSLGPPLNSFNFPYTWLTFQYPHSGNGFVGMDRGFFFNRPNEYLTNLDRSREYFSAELLDTLQEGVIYCVGGYMNNRNLSIVPADTNSFWEVFTDRISVGFHSNTPQLNNTWLFSGVEHVCRLTKEDSTLITDTLGWEHIRTPYQASGNEQVIIMGNLYSDTVSGTYFNTDFNLDSIYALPPEQVLQGFYSTFTYFYFDDIYVIPIHQPHIEMQNGENGYVWLIDTTEQEERSWYKTGDDLVLGNGDSLYLQVSNGSSYTLHTRNCRVEMSDTVVIDLSGLAKLKEETQIRLYPNPCHGTLNVDLKGDIAIMRLFSITGQLLLDRQILSKEAITLDNIGTGTYVVQIMTKSGTIKHERLVVIP